MFRFLFILLLPISIVFAASPPERGGFLIPEYVHIRDHVEGTPEKVERDLDLLAAYLVSITKTDAEKAYAIYYWITNNIAYDVTGFRSGRLGDLSPASVLKRKQAVCSGYSRLFVDLANKAGLEAKEISGGSKGYSYSADTPLSIDHAWNIVKVNGKWQLLDATWAAGHVNTQFNRRQNDFYFFTPPEQFIYDHFPEDEKWQLLSEPISEQAFIDNVELDSWFFLYDLKLDSHMKSTIETEKDILITLQASEDILFSAKLLDSSSNKQNNHVFSQRENGKQSFYVSFPKKGKYELAIFAKKTTSNGKMYKHILKYDINVPQLNADPKKYPKTYSTFDKHQAFLYYPLDLTLNRGKEYYFKVKLSNALEVAVINDGKFTHLHKDGDIFSGKVTVIADKVSLNAKFDPSVKSFSTLVEYITE